MPGMILRLTDEQHARVRQAAQAQGVSVSALCRRAVLAALDGSDSARLARIEEAVKTLATRNGNGHEPAPTLTGERAAACAALVSAGWTEAKAARTLAAMTDAPAAELIRESLRKG